MYFDRKSPHDGGNFRRPLRTPPIKEGETLEVIVESMGSKGDGIAKHKGFVIVLPGAQVGDRVSIKVTAVRGKVSFGEVLETLEQNVPIEAAQDASAATDLPIEEPVEAPEEEATEEVVEEPAEEVQDEEPVEEPVEEADEEPVESEEEAIDETEDSTEDTEDSKPEPQ